MLGWLLSPFGALSAAVAGYLASGAAEGADDEAESEHWFASIVGSLVLVLVTVFGGLGLLLWLGVGDQVVKPIFSAIERYFRSLVEIVSSLIPRLP